MIKKLWKIVAFTVSPAKSRSKFYWIFLNDISLNTMLGNISKNFRIISSKKKKIAWNYISTDSIRQMKLLKLNREFFKKLKKNVKIL